MTTMTPFATVPFDSNPDEVGDPTLSKELTEAGAVPLKVTFTKASDSLPTATNIIGYLRFIEGALVVLSRKWSYWVVKSSKPLSSEKASALNEVFGRVVRAHGISGGSSGDLGTVSQWHVDTHEGLNALVSALTQEFGELTTSDPPTLADTVVQGLLADGYN